MTNSDFLFPTFNLLCWLILGIGVAALARELGASPATTWLAAAAAALTCAPMAHATATNSDLPATAPLIAAAVMAARWIRTGHSRYALLAGLGLGLSIGTKPTAFFFFPWAAVIALAAILSGRLRRAVAAQAMLLAVAAALVGGGWLVRNYLDAGRLSPRPETMHDNRWWNPGFSMESAGRGVYLHAVQFVLHPFAALAPQMPVAEQIMENQLAQIPGFPAEPPGGRGYPFALRFSPVSEDTAWFGFTGLFLWLPALAFGFLLHAHRSIPYFLLAGASVTWLIAYYGYTSWIPFGGRYMILPYGLAAAGIAVALEALRRRLRPKSFTFVLSGVSALLLFSFAVDLSLAAFRNAHRNLFEAVDLARKGRRKHFLSYGAVRDGTQFSFDAVNLLRDLKDIAADLPEVTYLNRGRYFRPYATMTTLGFSKRYLWREWTAPPSESSLLALPSGFCALYFPSRPGNASAFAMPASDDAWAYFALSPSQAARLDAAQIRHPFVAFWLRDDPARLYAFGRAGDLRYRWAGQRDWTSSHVLDVPAGRRALEFDEDGDGAADASLEIPAKRMTFDGGYPAPPLKRYRLRDLRRFKTVGEINVRAHRYASSEPFDVQLLARPNDADAPWTILAEARGVTRCDPALMPLDTSALRKGSWCVVYGIRRSDSPNGALAPPNAFDDAAVFDLTIDD